VGREFRGSALGPPRRADDVIAALVPAPEALYRGGGAAAAVRAGPWSAGSGACGARPRGPRARVRRAPEKLHNVPNALRPRGAGV